MTGATLALAVVVAVTAVVALVAIVGVVIDRIAASHERAIKP